MSACLDWTAVGLATDPVPGDPDVLARGGDDYLEVAEAITDARTTLARIDLGTFVVSEAVDAIRTTAAEVAENIGRARGRRGLPQRRAPLPAPGPQR